MSYDNNISSLLSYENCDCSGRLVRCNLCLFLYYLVKGALYFIHVSVMSYICNSEPVVHYYYFLGKKCVLSPYLQCFMVGFSSHEHIIICRMLDIVLLPNYYRGSPYNFITWNLVYKKCIHSLI